jgi:phosphoglycolate phosphatase-like HAD superfamily hydrolase
VKAGAQAKLSYFGLWEHFAFGGFGDEHHDRDLVAADALRAAAEFIRRDPDRVWVIGDTPLDVRCARAIGAKAVAVATGYHDAMELAAARPDVLLPDLSNHTRLLEHFSQEM